jgi:hypothetical protein
MSLTQQFFAEGEIQEARAWKNSPLLFEETTEPEATKYTSFDRVPRRWTPIVIATLLVGIAGAGGAWAMGLWQPPPGVVSWANRFDPRVIFTPTAPSAAALVSSTPAVPSANAPRVEAAEPVPTEVAATADVAAPAPTPIAPIAPAAPPETTNLGAATAALAATADAPVARSQSHTDSEPAEVTAAPMPVVVPLPARSAASPADDARATTTESARQRPTHRERVTPASKARHGYVWSDQRGNLVPAMPVTAGTAAGAPDDTLPVSAELSGTRADQGSSSARAAGAWDSERADREQPAPPEPPRQHPPTSSASATEPRPIPVPAIEAPKKLPEPTEMAAPSGP